MSDEISTGTTEFRLKTDPAKEYDIQIRYFHLKALMATMILGTTCLLYLAPLLSYPGIVVPESLNMISSGIIGSFFMGKGTSENKKENK